MYIVPGDNVIVTKNTRPMKDNNQQLCEASLIYADGMKEPEAVQLPPQDSDTVLKTLQGYVGGLIQLCPVRPELREIHLKGKILIVNEEGINLGLRQNALASMLANTPLFGDAILLDNDYLT